MIIAKNTVEKKEEGEYTYLKIHTVKEPITREVFDDICEWVGESTDYQEYVYMDISESCFFWVDDVITYLEENMLDQYEDREDYEIERAKRYIELLRPYKEYSIHENER